MEKKYSRYLKNSLYIIFILCIVFTCFLVYLSNASVSLPGHIESSRTIEVSTGWQYCIGEFPVNSQGLPLCFFDESANKNWKNLKYMSRPSNPKDASSIWLKVKLPNTSLENPLIYIKTQNQAFEMYIDKKLVYYYPSGENSDKRAYLGYQNHFIPIEKSYQGQYVYLKVSSDDASNLGIIREFHVGSKISAYEYIFIKNCAQFILSFIFIFIGLLMLIAFLHKFNRESAYFSIGLFSLCIGIWSLTQNDLKLLFYNNPIVWFYLDILSLYSAPAGLCLFLIQVFNIKSKSILKQLWKLFILYEILVVILDITSIYPIYNTLGPYYLLLFITMFILFLTTIKIALKDNIGTVIFSAGLFCMFISVLYDILGEYMRLVVWRNNLTPIGMLIFELSLVTILFRRFFDINATLRIYSKEIEDKNKALQQMFLEIKVSHEQLASWNEALELAVAEKTESLRNLLDNAGQGFLSFGKDMLIRKEYSNECTKIFGFEIDSKDFTKLIFPDDEAQRTFFTDIASKVLVENNDNKRNILLSLIPDEAMINDKVIQINYKLITGDSGDRLFMCILTDITEKRCLESQMELERNTLKMVVKVVANYSDFIGCVKDYKIFCFDRINMLLRSKLSLEEIIFIIFKDVHTFKGSFSQLEMFSVVEKLNEFEDRISELCNSLKHLTIQDVENFFSGFNMYKWLEKDLDILTDILGEQFFRLENTISVDKLQLLEIENKVISMLPPFECRFLLPYLKMLRFKPFKELLQSYPNYVMKLSGQLEKLITPFVIEGGDFRVDSDIYYGFIRSLTHIFRNIIDHGIEPVEERLLKGKDEYGNISCSVTASEGKIQIVITDDGLGIASDLILEKALSSGFIDKESASALTEHEIINLIFKKGFSTRNVANEISGRGIGLYSVKSEVDKLGGSIEVNSIKNEGTEFNILLPYEDLTKISIPSVLRYIEPVVITTKTLFNEQTGLILEDASQNCCGKTECVVLKDITAFIDITGVLDGTFILSSDESLLQKIIQSFIVCSAEMYTLEEDESAFIPEDILAEFFNTVMGNSLKAFTDSEDLITIDTPVTISSSKNALLKYPGCGIWTNCMKCSEGTLSITFMTSMNTFEQ